MANKIYTAFENDVFFRPGGEVNFQVQSTPNGSGTISDPRRLHGTAAAATLFEWHAKSACTGTPAAQGAIDIYLVRAKDFSAGPNGFIDGNMASGTALVGDTRKPRNFQYVGALRVDNTTPNLGAAFIGGGIVNVTSPYIALYWQNNAGAALTTMPTDHAFILTPLPREIQ